MIETGKKEDTKENKSPTIEERHHREDSMNGCPGKEMYNNKNDYHRSNGRQCDDKLRGSRQMKN